MFENALRHHLPIDPAAVADNLKSKDLARTVKAHKFAADLPRHFFSGDAIHASVQFTDEDRRRFIKDPQFALSVIDDAGASTPFPAAARNA
jgi:hypothetical protein